MFAARRAWFTGGPVLLVASGRIAMRSCVTPRPCPRARSPAGVANVTINYLGLPLIDQSVDVCKSGFMDCPFKAGPYNVDQTADIPSITPKGAYTGTFSISDQDGAAVICVNFEANMV